MLKSGMTVLGLTLSSALAFTPAKAADTYSPGRLKDVPYVDVANWTGFYGGVHLGGAWGDLTVHDFDESRETFKNNTSSFFGGGTLGYNLQRGRFVFGLEADFGGMDLAHKQAQPNDPPIVSAIDSGAYGDLTGRLGYSFGGTLIYAKGGFAFFNGDVKVTDIPDHTMITTQSNLTGWTIGGGLEHKLSPAWSVKAEYQFFDFGSGQASMRDDGDRFRTDLTVQTVKAGVNYHFGGYETLK
jgi:outer membrane immunogenic protein